MIDVDEEYSGIVVEKLTARRAELKDMRPAGAGKQRLVFHAPSRALIGYHGEFLTDTRGTGVLNRVFHAYEPFKGAIQQRHTGVLISGELGEFDGLRAVEPGGSRPAVHRRRREDLFRA